TVLRCENPEAAFTQVILAFAPEIPEQQPGTSPAAHVDESATVHVSARLAPGVVVGPGASVGESAVLHPGVVVGAHASVGANTVLHPHVVLYPHAEVGARCILHAGVVVGSDGSGFHPVPAGVPDDALWQKTPQVGNAVVEDDCEIGAGSTIDCARFGSTRIGRGCKLDNLVHVGHNVQVGRDTLLLAHVGIAGSTTIGKNVIVAGQAGITGHVHIGDGAVIMGGAGVIADVEPGVEMFGYPAAPRREKLRSIVAAEKAGKDVRAMKKEIKELRAQLDKLLSQSGAAEGGMP
ncbi:MAG: UDP-3-O-(3-hydroxymyristoyl)glucosamine N-acyltransferase, partial [Planctomycetota bacterium]